MRYLNVMLIIYHTLIYNSLTFDFQISLIIFIGGEKLQSEVVF